MRKFMLGVLALALAACGGDSTGPIANAVGTWNLQTINGSPLPFTLFSQASPVLKLEVLSESFVAQGNGTYVATAVVRQTDGTTVTTQSKTDNGTWVQNNGAITLTASDGTVSSGAITGDTITANESGDVFVFRRQ